MRDAAFSRLRDEAGPVDRPDFHLVTARDHPLGFFEYADLLTTPTHRGLSVRDPEGNPFQYRFADAPSVRSGTLSPGQARGSRQRRHPSTPQARANTAGDEASRRFRTWR